MDSRAFDFTARPVDPRVEPVAPPVNGATPASRHASWTGARAVVETWTARQSAYLQLIRQAGALSDQEAAALLHWQLCSVNSVRGALRKRGIPIIADGFDEHRFTDGSGRAHVTRRTRWRLAMD
jgi:hypothetical protein